MNALAVALLLAPLGTSVEVKINKGTLTVITSLTNDAINSAVWTGWIPVEIAQRISFEIDYTRSTGTDVSMTCETTDDATIANDAGFELHKLQDSATAGTSDSNAHIWRNVGTTSALWTWTVANLPHYYINCSFIATGGGVNDKATVLWRRLYP